MNDTAHRTDLQQTYRVAQWSAGRIGRSAMRATLDHPRLELVGLLVHSADKEGRDAGVLCGRGPVGVVATRSVDDLIALEPDCVLYMREGYDVHEMTRLLAAGIDLITTRSEFFHPPQMDPALREPLEAACREGGTSLFATGSSPGFSTAVLPSAMLYMTRRLDCLTIDEYADIPASVTPDMITEVMGFGRPAPEEFSQRTLDHVSSGFAQSLGIVAAGMGVEVDSFETRGEFALARSDVEIPGNVVLEAGMVAAQRITTAAVKDDSPLLQFRANWYCTHDIDRDWDLGANGWRLQVEGDTTMDVRISFPRASGEDTEAFADRMSGHTAHPAVNAVAYVCDAAPGILTNLDLPVIVPRL